MLRSTITSLRNCPNRKLKLQLIDQLQRMTFVRNVTPRTRSGGRRIPRLPLKGKKSSQVENFSEFCKSNAILPVPGLSNGTRYRSHSSQAAPASKPLEVEAPVFSEKIIETNPRLISGNQMIAPKEILTSMLVPPQNLSVVGVIDDHVVEPLKLINAIDPKILSQLYRPPQSNLSLYLKLAKSRLSTFVVITAASGYAIGTSSYSADLAWICMGTFLTSASAHTFNQIMEVNYDGMMDRTKNRVLVQKLISRKHAIGFGVVSGIIGASTLYSVNDLCALIGLGNLLMYTCMYTPMKRMHIGNTWLGSVVGALPPLIGYAGACGYIDAKAAILSAIMFCWQFPHFNALSWNLRNDYDRAGYKMMCFVNPRLCRHTTLRYSVILSAICAASPLTGASEAVFVIDSGVLNAYLCYLSWEFYKNPDAKTSRSLFRYSLIHLPLLMIFLLISNGMVKSKENKVKVDTV